MGLLITVSTGPGDAFAREKAELTRLKNIFGNLHGVVGITVGSEGLYRGDYTPAYIASRIRNVRSLVRSLGEHTLPVGTSDVYYKFDNTVINASDVLYMNSFSYWEGVRIEDAARTFIEHVNVLKSHAKGKPIVVSETGWPTAGNTIGGAVPGNNQLKTYLNGVVCGLKNSGIPIYWFSAFDEPNRGGQIVEKHFGLYNANRTKKPGFDLHCG